MHMHNHEDGQEPEEIDASQGYEQTDAKVSGIVVFLASLAIFVLFSFGLSYGIGKLINAKMTKDDGPASKWSKTADVRELGNLPNNPEMQNKVAEITQQFPEPRVQTDDGNQDIADLHAREDLLLNHYSWVDKSQGKVRIPISVAKQLILQRGLPVAPAVEKAQPLTADAEPTVTAPLTSGFARTGYEQEQTRLAAAESKQGK